jgi:cellulose synthase/poly-beta-1,6-N-acetylglucosamine synthase-like glycosyltransferase
MIPTLLLIAALIYVAQMLILRHGLAKADAASRREDYEPTVAVIVAARNEEERILPCLESLAKLDYPSDKLEVIIVNDSSTDRTAEVVRSFAETGLRIVNAAPGRGNLRGKANALAQGIESTSAEILMFTDADCVVLPSWVRETAQFFDDQTGIVGGFTVLDANRPFEGMQALDWIFLFGLSASTAGLNIPLTAIGNNLSVRRTAYAEVGGYRCIPFSVTEDYSLVQAILQHTKYKLKFPARPGAMVRSQPCRTWKQLFHQKKRWGVGGLNMVPRGLFITAIGWFLKFFILLGAVSGHFSSALAGFVTMAVAEFLFLVRPIRQFGLETYWRYFPAFVVYFALYVLALPFVAYFSRNVKWKERQL